MIDRLGRWRLSLIANLGLSEEFASCALEPGPASPVDPGLPSATKIGLVVFHLAALMYARSRGTTSRKFCIRSVARSAMIPFGFAERSLGQACSQSKLARLKFSPK